MGQHHISHQTMGRRTRRDEPDEAIEMCPGNERWGQQRESAPWSSPCRTAGPPGNLQIARSGAFLPQHYFPVLRPVLPQTGTTVSRPVSKKMPPAGAEACRRQGLSGYGVVARKGKVFERAWRTRRAQPSRKAMPVTDPRYRVLVVSGLPVSTESGGPRSPRSGRASTPGLSGRSLSVRSPSVRSSSVRSLSGRSLSG